MPQKHTKIGVNSLADEKLFKGTTIIHNTLKA